MNNKFEKLSGKDQLSEWVGVWNNRKNAHLSDDRRGSLNGEVAVRVSDSKPCQLATGLPISTDP